MVSSRCWRTNGVEVVSMIRVWFSFSSFEWLFVFKILNYIPVRLSKILVSGCMFSTITPVILYMGIYFVTLCGLMNWKTDWSWFPSGPRLTSSGTLSVDSLYTPPILLFGSWSDNLSEGGTTRTDFEVVSIDRGIVIISMAAHYYDVITV